MGKSRNTQHVQELIKDNQEALAQFEKLLNSQNEEKISAFFSIMSNFLNGFGSLKYQDALLTCAQISNRKSFDILVLDEDEFRKFLDTFAASPRPNRQKLIMVDNHWLAADMEIDKDGAVRMALFDSLGIKQDEDGLSISGHALDVIRRFRKVFPEAPIYFSEEVRQNAEKGCSVFALDDATHLFNLEKYIKSNIFDYFAQQQKNLTNVALDKDESLLVFRCNLPLPLLRTMQSERGVIKIMNNAKLRANQSENIQRFTHSVNQFFQPHPEKRDKKVNTRLEYEFEKMAKYNAIYLLTHDEATIRADMDRLTLQQYEAASAPIKPLRL